MAALRRFVRRLLALFRSNRAERDLAREVDAHLQLLEDSYRAAGMSATEARHAARRSFGGVEQAKEHQRDTRTFRPLAGASTDFKLGARMLLKSPGLTIVGVTALAVAISFGVAYFEFLTDFANPKLKFAGGDRIVGIVNVDLSSRTLNTQVASDFDRWRQQMRTVQDLGAEVTRGRNLVTDDGRADPVRAVEISASAFRVMPMQPVVGRPLVAADERPGAPAVAVIGYDVWLDRFGGDTQVAGRMVRIDNVPHEIVGVMPEGFAFPTNHNLWTPLRLNASGLTYGQGPSIRIFGKLAPGVGLAAAQAELDALVASAPAAARPRNVRAQVLGYGDSLRAPDRGGAEMKALYAINLLFIALLGICGANVATLIFARTATREGEITVRTALGASRSRIVVQLVAEAFVLVAVAAIVGLFGASYLLKLGKSLLEEGLGQPMPFWWDTALGADTLVYTAVLVVIASLLVGGVPALKATGRRLHGRLKQAGSTGSSPQFGRMWTAVVVAQVALTVVFLLVVAGFGWEAIDIRRKFVEVSFPRADYLTGNLSMPGSMTPDRRTVVLEDIVQRLRASSLVVDATYSTALPAMEDEQLRFQFASEAIDTDVKARFSDSEPWVRGVQVGTNYFETYSQQLVAGRTFTPAEIASGQAVAVVDESFVQLVLGGRPAIGQLLRQRQADAKGPAGRWFEIIGVVKDISTMPARKPYDAKLYRPLGSGPQPSLHLVVRARENAAALATPLRKAAIDVDPALRLRDVLTLDRAADVEMKTLRYFIQSMAVISGVALLLSTAGIYALIAFTLTRRTREIGIRTALGASRGRVIVSVLRRALRQVATGVAIGALPGGALFSAQAREYGSGAAMAMLITGAIAAFIIGVAVVACIAPVKRALRIQPTEALRLDS